MRRLAIILILAGLAAAQTPGPKFDVISVKPGDASAQPRFHLDPSGRYTADNVKLATLLDTAFDVDTQRLIGLPAWAENARFSVDAVPPPGLPPLTGSARNDRLQVMLRALLTDRFGLITHTESRDLPVYLLVPVKAGAKFPPPPATGQPAIIVGPYDPKQPDRGVPTGPGMASSMMSGMNGLVRFLGNQLHRPVMDKTGITGNYDIRLSWQPQPGDSAASMVPDTSATLGPGIFSALDEQLGLRLESSHAPVDVIVIDRLTPPTPN